jgi:hypothetical protein
MRKFLSLAAGCLIFVACNQGADQKADETTVAPATADAKPQPAEIADAKYMDMGKSSISSMSAGNVEGWLANYADNAVYVWNNGDSLAGKAAIMDYWKKRRTDVIDSINFTNDIWLPVKVNQPQNNFHLPGVWLLGWYMTNAKYKTGKSMTQWIHTAMHFNSEDKIDRAIMFLDREPITKAMKK